MIEKLRNKAILLKQKEDELKRKENELKQQENELRTRESKFEELERDVVNKQEQRKTLDSEIERLTHNFSGIRND